MHQAGATQLQRQPRSSDAPHGPNSAQTRDSDSQREGGHATREADAGLHRHPEPAARDTPKGCSLVSGRRPNPAPPPTATHRSPPRPSSARALSRRPSLDRTGLRRNAGPLLRPQGSCPWEGCVDCDPSNPGPPLSLTHHGDYGDPQAAAPTPPEPPAVR